MSIESIHIKENVPEDTLKFTVDHTRSHFCPRPHDPTKSSSGICPSLTFTCPTLTSMIPPSRIWTLFSFEISPAENHLDIFVFPKLGGELSPIPLSPSSPCSTERCHFFFTLFYSSSYFDPSMNWKSGASWVPTSM